jgi:hypothetical protein
MPWPDRAASDRDGCKASMAATSRQQENGGTLYYGQRDCKLYFLTNSKDNGATLFHLGLLRRQIDADTLVVVAHVSTLIGKGWH